MFGMFRKRTPQPEASAGAVRVYVEDKWVTKGFVIRMGLLLSVAGPALATLIIPFVDQWIRNWVDNVTSAPDTFDSLAIGSEEYGQLPIYWRQALAEIPLLPKEEARDAQNIIEALKVDDIRLIDRIAPYMVSGALVRQKAKLSEHPMPELSYAHFSHLQNLGILEDVNDGRVIPTVA